MAKSTKIPVEASSRLRQEAAIQKAKQAARAGDPAGMVAALYESGSLDGLQRWLARNPSVFSHEDARDVISEAVEHLYAQVADGMGVHHPVAFLRKVCRNKRANLIRTRVKEEAAAREWQGADVGHETLPTTFDDEDASETGTWVDDEPPTAEAIALARRLLPRLGQQNVQAVMGLLLEALAIGRGSISSAEIGDALDIPAATVRKLKERGIQRLQREAQLEGLVPGHILRDLRSLHAADDSDED